jgi:hypothetical protein
MDGYSYVIIKMIKGSLLIFIVGMAMARDYTQV